MRPTHRVAMLSSRGVCFRDMDSPLPPRYIIVWTDTSPQPLMTEYLRADAATYVERVTRRVTLKEKQR